MLSNEEIIRILAARLNELAADFYVAKIGIFGSYATGKQNDNSDIDFVVKFSDACPDLFETKYQLKQYLRDLFGKEVDVANIDYLKPYVLNHIKSELRYVG